MKAIGAALLLALIGAITTSYSVLAGTSMLVVAGIVLVIGSIIVWRDPGGSFNSKRGWSAGGSGRTSSGTDHTSSGGGCGGGG